jgi:ubiquinone/menaquinone biosynthesis C-methylase UbiE
LDQATELNDVDAAMVRLTDWRARVPVLVARLSPYMSLAPGDPVLDVGAAQGVTVTALLEAGYQARGVEPNRQALATRHELIARTGICTDVVEGVAESLPFGDAEFQYVHMYSVLEHVHNPWTALGEAHRVLRPGGGLFVSTTSRLCPRQSEIRWWPCFPWYPDRAQRRVMDWAKRERPEMIGYTQAPAYWWFRHREVRARLHALGFAAIVDMWQLRATSGEARGWRRVVIDAAARSRVARTAGSLVVPGMEYLAVKPAEPT